jgi:ABC-type spermidine/putrescine transport system permease subunit II
MLGSLAPLAVLFAAIVGPLAWEYTGLRRDWGVSRLGALALTSTLFPSVAIGLAISLPLDGTPAVRWLVAIAVTIATYSLALAVLRPSEAPQRSS